MPSIQQSAALALGRLANYSDDLAEAVVGNEILPQLVYSLSEQNRFDENDFWYRMCAIADQACPTKAPDAPLASTLYQP